MNWEQVQKEAQVRTSRSGGPGGQHVNKVETRVELVFYPADSLAFTPKEKAALLAFLEGRLTAEGSVTVASQESRSQARNRELAWEKLERLLREGIQPPKPPRQAGAFAPSPQGRKAVKSKLSEKKAMRRPPDLSSLEED
jgi:ribosome-associated protein